MSVTGSGVGGSIGGPQQPPPMQQELSATDQIPRQMMGIVKNDQDILLTAFGRASFGPDKRDFYRSDASNPNLARPLHMFRVGTGLVDLAGVPWEMMYEQLLQLMNEKDRNALKKDKELSKDLRNAYMMAMEESLKNTAKLLAHFDQAAQGINQEAAQARASNNAMTPFSAVPNAVVGSLETDEETKKYLEEAGPNDPDYDKLALVMRRMHAFAERLDAINKEMIKKGATPEMKKLLADLTDQLAKFVPQAHKLLSSGSLTILVTTLNMLRTISATASLTGLSPMLLIGFTAALEGLETTHFGLLGNKIASGLHKLALPKADHAVQEMLQHMVGLGLVVCAAIALLSNTPPSEEEENEQTVVVEQAKRELSLTLLKSTGIIKEIYSEFANSLGADKKGQALIAAALTAVSYLVIALIWTPKDADVPIVVSDVIRPELAVALANMANAIDEGINKGIFNSEDAAQFAAASQRAGLALEKEDFDVFYATLHECLANIDLNLDVLKKDLSNLDSIAKTCAYTIDPEIAKIPTATIIG